MSDPRLTPFQVLASAFSISSFCGLASLLRSGHPLTPRAFVSAITNSGAMGLIIALLWYNWFDGQRSLFFLLGISGLAGIGGMTIIDFVVQVFRNGGVNISIGAQDEEPTKRKPKKEPRK